MKLLSWSRQLLFHHFLNAFLSSLSRCPEIRYGSPCNRMPVAEGVPARVHRQPLRRGSAATGA